jgi:hypothetical protein
MAQLRRQHQSAGAATDNDDVMRGGGLARGSSGRDHRF